MGIASYDVESDELGQLAQNAIELAEKRGGDQVVVNIQGEKIQYFGGNTNSLEKNTLVETRMQAQAIKKQRLYLNHLRVMLRLKRFFLILKRLQQLGIILLQSVKA